LNTILKIFPQRVFFKKKQIFGENLQRLATSGHDIRNDYKSRKLTTVGQPTNVDFPFLPLESTQSHSPGQQTPGTTFIDIVAGCV